jgi:UDP-glucose 4-epimerase
MRNRPTALVTGAAGFIGAHLVRALGELDRCHVIALDDLSGGFRENLPDEVAFVEGSVTDDELVSGLFDEHEFDLVYHLGAYAAEGLSHFIRRFNYTNNLIGSVNLINEAVKHDSDCFVFTSSIAVYGAAQVPMREEMTPEPEDPYGIAKYAVELDLRAAHEMFGLDHVVFRPHNVYGEYQNIGDKYRNVVGIFMNQILRGEPMTVFGDGEQQRAFSYVGDIIDPIARAPWVEEAANRVFNVGADETYTVNELAEAVAEAMGEPGHPVTHLEARDEVEVAYSDHAAAREVFGEPPGTTLSEGLERMAAWVEDVGARKSPEFEEIEVYENMPPSWLEGRDDVPSDG